MTDATSTAQIHRQLSDFDAGDAAYATQFVETLLAEAANVGASDVHLQPTPAGLQVRWRLDGVLQQLGVYAAGETADVVSRLKVLADLLTYRNDVPQEGRIRNGSSNVEMRVSTFPTLHGERAAVRLFAASNQFEYLQDLGLPDEIEAGLTRLLGETSGAVIVAGPAGSGKTTTVYAALRELVRTSRESKNIVSLEDPIEVAVEGVAQSQVNQADYDLATGLRSIMRQDPEVIAVGEIRDRETAETAMQASLTGHLVLTTFHAGTAAAAISRLSDMGIEPYLLRSGILGVVCQRLLRRLCSCAHDADDVDDRLGLPVDRAHCPAGCDGCLQTGYRGRMALAELIHPTGELGQALLSRHDAEYLHQLAVEAGMTPLWQRAVDAVQAGHTSPAEVRRVLGFSFDTRGLGSS